MCERDSTGNEEPASLGSSHCDWKTLLKYHPFLDCPPKRIKAILSRALCVKDENEVDDENST